MNMKMQTWIGLVLVAAVLVIGGVFFVYSRTALAPTTGVVSGGVQASTTTTTLGDGVSVTAKSGTTIKMLPTGSSGGAVKQPSLTGPIIISASLPTDAQALLRTKEEALIAQLQKDPTSVGLWLDLGIDRKMGGDYTGAAAAWEYVAKAAPASASYIAYGNLGGLYMDFLKDYPKAESNYKQAIALNPRVVDYYRELYTLYKYVYKTNTTAAVDILVQGLKANPGNPDLLALQQQQ